MKREQHGLVEGNEKKEKRGKDGNDVKEILREKWRPYNW